MTMLAVAPPWKTTLSINVRCATLVLPIAIGRLSSSPLRPLPKEAFNERRQQTASAEIRIASEAPPRPPPAVSSVGGLRTPAPECVVPSSWAGIPQSSHQRKSMHHQRYLWKGPPNTHKSLDESPLLWLAGRIRARIRPPFLLENPCLLYTSPSPRDGLLSRMPSSA